jgi:hypothetical protein
MALDPERDRPAHRPHHADDLPPVGVGRASGDGQEIAHHADPVLRQKPRDQNGGLRPVELLGRYLLSPQRNLEVAARFGVKDARKDARCIEARQAAPVDGAVFAHEGHGVHVADEAVVLDRAVGSLGPLLWDSAHGPLGVLRWGLWVLN